MLNTERLLKHAVQERLAVTICINKVSICITYDTCTNLKLIYIYIIGFHNYILVIKLCFILRSSYDSCM